MAESAARRVVGIDPSLTSTGAAVITAEGGAYTHTITTKPTPGATVVDRDRRMQFIADELAEITRGADLIVIEGPALGKASPHTWDRAGLWWRIVHRLHTETVPLGVCPPTVRAKWATGKGNAGKAAVVAAIARMWPYVELADDNAADALVLATMAAQQLGTTGPVLARHRAALTSVAWPDLVPAA